MISLKKALGLKGKEANRALAPLVLTDSLCSALSTLSQVFGQTWHQHVVSELLSARQAGRTMSGTALANVINKLLEEASGSRPGLSLRFLVTATQIVYRSADRRYTVLIVQGEADTVRLVWQVSTRRAGTSYISYIVHGNAWTPIDWKVAAASQQNLDLLAKAGGEVLGFLGEAKLLPVNSAFQRALDAQIAATSSLREKSSYRPPPTPAG